MHEAHSGEIPFEYSEITANIFIGTNACCQSHFSEQLLSKGVTVDISLEEKHLDAPFGVELYTWIPVKDHTAPSLDQLKMGVSIVQEAVECGKKVYVHCKNGHGRAPTLVAAYLVTQGKTAGQAQSFLKERRPSIHIEGAQHEQVLKFEKSLSRTTDGNE